jgi:phospholipid-binding lipoprotein MlaA
MKNIILVFMLALVTVGAVSITIPAYAQQTQVQENDPLETVNRGIYKFNSFFDELLFKPFAKLYRAILPGWGRKAVGNVLHNIAAPVNVLNNVLQGKGERAVEESWRFVINSTFGIGGILDVASSAGLKRHPEDFGQTLGYYGVGSGPYLVLPFLGSSNLRDGLGLVADTFTTPTTYIDPQAVSFIHAGVRALHIRETAIEILDDIEADSFDSYATIRSLYAQHRANVIKK